MKRIYVLLAALVLWTGAWAQSEQLVRNTPEAEGLSSRYVKQFFDSIMSAKSTDIHSCIVMRHGHVIGEIYPTPWRQGYRHTMYSASKTFTAAAVGMCIQDSLLTLNDSIGQYLEAYIDSLTSDTVRNIRVRDLLTMESGLPVDTRMRTYETQWLHAYLNNKPKAGAGELWAYDSIVTYMLSAIVQQVTGMKLMDFLQERLFAPLGIYDAAWEESPEGITCGGWGLYITPESMAKFGQLMLRGGRWNGVQIIPSWWVSEMMMVQTERKNYGYQMWQFQEEGWAQANGAYGQYIYVMPKEDMVITMTQCNHGSVPFQRWITNLLSNNCKPVPLPVVQKTVVKTITGKKGTRRETTKLPSDLELLRKAQESYALKTINGSRESRKYNHRSISVSFAENMLGWEKAEIKLGYDGVKLKVTDHQLCTYTISLGYGKWEVSQITGWPYNPRKFMNNFSNLPSKWHVAASYAWSDDQTLNMRMHWIDWLSSADISIKFSGASATLTVKPQDTGKGVKTGGFIR